MGGGWVLITHLQEGETEADTMVPVLGKPRARECGLDTEPFCQRR